ncbi:GNVR domain-containing protein [Burkholderia cepacia]|uniref:GNVR domain-containing protein n=1 Tax=Burkholderia cepacia TaxID=292 RepID=UPI0026529D3E|nr:GNVR domain-containing protein [Burkholderia cepacia]MDN7854286.1 GNVR domain-containing protein [Burkholderia cepacia]
MTLDRPSSKRSRDGSGSISRNGVDFTLVQLLENVFDHWRVFLAVFLGCLLLAIVYAVTATPMYSVDTLIQVEENKHSALGSLSEISNALDIQNSAVVGEIDIARSRAVVTQAIDATVAQVDVSVRNTIPLVGGLLGSILSKDRNGLVEPLLNTPFWAWGGERIEFTKFDVPDAQIGKKLELDYLEGNRFLLKNSNGQEVLAGQVGQPTEANGYRVEVSRIVARAGTEFRVRRVATPVRLEAVLKKLNGAETKRQSGIMQLSFEDPDPVYAARLLNAIAAAYLDAKTKRRSEDAEHSLAFLDTQLPVVKKRLEQAEHALNEFRNAQGSIDAQGDVQLLIDQLALVEKSRLEAKLEYQDLASKYVAGQPQLTAVASKLKTLDQQSAELKSKVARLPSQQQTYLRLSRDVEVNNQLYIGLMNNAQQLQIAKAGTVGNASVIDKADVTDKPVQPKRLLVIVLGAAIGLILGVASAQGCALFFQNARNPEHLEEVAGVPVLGIVPTSLHQVEADLNDRSAFIAVREYPDTPLAEALDDLALLLRYATTATQGKSRIVLVTSPEPGQGRSMISANLAHLFSQSGLKTLLVRADADESGADRYVSTKYPAGMSDVLTGSRDLGKAIYNVRENFDVLPAGKRVEPSRHLFEMERLDPLITALRREYDAVVVDAPVARPVAKVAMLSRLADVTLMVARQGSVSYAGVADVIRNLNRVGVKVDGLVFNGFQPSPLRRRHYANIEPHTKEAKSRNAPGDVVPVAFLFRAWERVRKGLLRNVA